MKPPEYERHLPIREENQGELVNQLVETKIALLPAPKVTLVNLHSADLKNAHPNLVQMCQ